MELSCGLPPGPEFAQYAALAEQLGYRRIWVFGSAPLWEDPFVHLARAAERTTTIELSTAVLIPSERSVMATVSSIATIARLSGNRFRACFGTGFTAQYMSGRKPMPLDPFIDYVRAVRLLLAGETAMVDGRAVRMMHGSGLAAARPINVPIWLSVTGPRGMARAPEVADGTVGPPHPTLPTATMVSGTVLEPGERPDSERARAAIGPWRVVPWHAAYAAGGAAAVDAMPGGAAWREALEKLAPQQERHLFTFEGHVTHLPERDQALLAHIDSTTLVAEEESMARKLNRMGQSFSEVMFTPSGPDVARELRMFASAHRVSGAAAR